MINQQYFSALNRALNAEICSPGITGGMFRTIYPMVPKHRNIEPDNVWEQYFVSAEMNERITMEKLYQIDNCRYPLSSVKRILNTLPGDILDHLFDYQLVCPVCKKVEQRFPIFEQLNETIQELINSNCCKECQTTLHLLKPPRVLIVKKLPHNTPQITNQISKVDSNCYLYRSDISYQLMSCLCFDVQLNCHTLIPDEFGNYYVCLNENQRLVVKTTQYKLPPRVEIDSEKVEMFLQNPLVAELFLKIGYPDIVFYRISQEPQILTEQDRLFKMKDSKTNTVQKTKTVGICEANPASVVDFMQQKQANFRQVVDQNLQRNPRRFEYQLFNRPIETKNDAEDAINNDWFVK